MTTQTQTNPEDELFHSNLNSDLNATPIRLIASSILSLGAAAYVALKNMSVSGMELSATNQLPAQISAPSAMAALKMDSSMAAWSLPSRTPGCLCQSTLIQCYGWWGRRKMEVSFNSLDHRGLVKEGGKKAQAYKHPSSGRIPASHTFG